MTTPLAFGKSLAIWALQLVVLSSVSQATSFVDRPLPESVKDAPLIVRGTVGAQSVDWGKERDGGKRIFTYWDLQVQEVLKGDAPTHLKMREMGGEKDGVGMQVSGAAQFDPGEDVVVMLGERNSEGTHDVWGLMTGKYELIKDGEAVTLQGAGIKPDSASPTTLDTLRQIISSQGDAPARPKPPVTPKPSPTPAPAPPADAAPQLHSPSPEQADRPDDSVRGWMPVWVAAVFALVGVIAWLLNKRRRK